MRARIFFVGQHFCNGQLLDNGNTVHLNAHVNYHIDGTGLSSGASYTSNAIGKASENFDLDNPAIGEATLIAHALIVGQGNVPNADADIHLHITVNANGTTTAFVPEIRLVTCH